MGRLSTTVIICANIKELIRRKGLQDNKKRGNKEKEEKEVPVKQHIFTDG